MSRHTSEPTPRTATADRVVKSVCPGCPGCAVGCGQNVYVKDEKVLSVLGAAGAVLLAGRGRWLAALSGGALLAASACTRFGVFEAGVSSARDPKYTVVPQRERLEAADR
jgi:anaerobic selenocysteine-containing dehydrogenase